MPDDAALELPGDRHPAARFRRCEGGYFLGQHAGERAVGASRRPAARRRARGCSRAVPRPKCDEHGRASHSDLQLAAPAAPRGTKLWRAARLSPHLPRPAGDTPTASCVRPRPITDSMKARRVVRPARTCSIMPLRSDSFMGRRRATREPLPPSSCDASSGAGACRSPGSPDAAPCSCPTSARRPRAIDGDTRRPA